MDAFQKKNEDKLTNKNEMNQDKSHKKAKIKYTMNKTNQNIL